VPAIPIHRAGYIDPSPLPRQFIAPPTSTNRRGDIDQFPRPMFNTLIVNNLQNLKKT
jgi:hypothetical protein